MWELQALEMVKTRSLPKSAFLKVKATGGFALANLQNAVTLRNRMGLKLAFLEDPLLTGMLAGKMVAGLASQIKSAAIKEAQQKADVAFQKGKAEDEARALIGPRGGLPTLRQDLVKLAALLRVTISDKMTVPEIKEAVRPSVELLKNQPKPKAKAEAEHRSKAPPRALAKASSVTRSSASALPLEVQSQLQVQQKEFQEMMAHVAGALNQLHQGREARSQGAVPNQFDLASSDVMMAEQCDDGWVPTQEDWDQINADGYRDLVEGEWRQRLEAQYGPEVEDLTEEEKTVVLDP